MVAEEARRQARVAKEAEEKSATRLQAAARGRNEREAFRGAAAARVEVSEDACAPSHRALPPAPTRRAAVADAVEAVRFHVNRNEAEILEATGAGRLVLSAADADGVVVVSGGVVYDSAYAFNSRKGDGSRQPALWSGPGEYEYSFALQPLGA